jgi:hypothetical protein
MQFYSRNTRSLVASIAVVAAVIAAVPLALPGRQEAAAGPHGENRRGTRKHVDRGRWHHHEARPSQRW